MKDVDKSILSLATKEMYTRKILESSENVKTANQYGLGWVINILRWLKVATMNSKLPLALSIKKILNGYKHEITYEYAATPKLRKQLSMMKTMGAIIEQSE